MFSGIEGLCFLQVSNSKWAADVTEIAIDCGHFIVEEEPRLGARALLNFFA
jgi:hypothetical protein